MFKKQLTGVSQLLNSWLIVVEEHNNGCRNTDRSRVRWDDTTLAFTQITCSQDRRRTHRCIAAADRLANGSRWSNKCRLPPLLPLPVRATAPTHAHAPRSILFSLSVRLSVKVRRSSDHFFCYSLARTCLESVNWVCAGNKSAWGHVFCLRRCFGAFRWTHFSTGGFYC